MKTVITISTLCCIGLLMLAMYLTYYSLWARIDSPAIYSASIEGDFIQGFMFALSYLIYKIPRQVVECKASKREFKYKRMLLIFISIWFITTIPLLLYHKSSKLSHPHYHNEPYSNMRAVVNALEMYENDCGIYPTSEQGLNALLEDPNVSNWAGPYLKNESLLADYWGNPFRYKTVNSKFVVWSSGRDHEEGTLDDITSDNSIDISELSDPNR